MNFFEAQAVARRSTVWLVLLFSMAVIGLILVTNILVLILSAYLETGQILFAYDTLHGYFQWSRFVAVSIAVTLLILGGSLIKSSQLSAGGHVIAEALGGQFIPQNSPEPHHRKIINVVEEMALASGSPVPKVYLLDEPGINAFAAGWTSSDAVIGITLGAVRQLSRDELQGVIAHEFSHILNGDMRLNIRLTGVLHGILLIGIIGYYLMRVMTYARSSRNEKGGSIVAVVIALGLGLVVIGYIGTFFGNMIKAMVSRQREYLADASSVQFTRNRDGISGALKKIGGIHHGSRLSSPAAPEFSHAYFAQGVSAFMGELFATHPPLKKRILRIDPRWDGKFTSTQASDEEGSSQSESVISDHSKKANHMTAATIGAVVADALHSIDHVGQPSEAHLGYARQLLTEIPAELKAESQDPYGVRALMYALLLHPSAAEQSKQCLLLEELIDAELYKKVMALAPLTVKLEKKLRLPMIDLSIPALRELSLPQYVSFKSVLSALIRADNKTDFSEWVVQRVLIQYMDEIHGLRKRSRPIYSHLRHVQKEVELLMTVVAYTEHSKDLAAESAFSAGRRGIDSVIQNMIPRGNMSLADIDKAVDKIDKLTPKLKQNILMSLAACVTADDHVTVSGAELLRAISASINCPMPPIIKCA